MGCAFTNDHVYVGSRYVPQIEGKWDINREYENFSIVIDTNNNSWTSKKNVPIGITLSNNEYWVQTGNFEGYVEELKKELEDKITALTQKHDGDIATVTASINTLSNRIDILNSAVSVINQELKSLDLRITNNYNELKSSIDNNVSALNVKIGDNTTKITNLESKHNGDIKDINTNIENKWNQSHNEVTALTTEFNNFKDDEIYDILNNYQKVHEATGINKGNVEIKLPLSLNGVYILNSTIIESGVKMLQIETRYIYMLDNKVKDSHLSDTLTDTNINSNLSTKENGDIVYNVIDSTNRDLTVLIKLIRG